MDNSVKIHKKRIIKDIVSPVLKANGFTQKGTNYSKTNGHLIIKMTLQSQRHYKEENVENFRLEVRVYPNFLKEEELCENAYFDVDNITEVNSSWIQITPAKDIKNLELWITNELTNKCNYFSNSRYIAIIEKKVLQEKETLLKGIALKQEELRTRKPQQKNLVNIKKNTIILYKQKIRWIDKWLEVR